MHFKRKETMPYLGAVFPARSAVLWGQEEPALECYYPSGRVKLAIWYDNFKPVLARSYYDVDGTPERRIKQFSRIATDADEPRTTTHELYFDVPGPLSRRIAMREFHDTDYVQRFQNIDGPGESERDRRVLLAIERHARDVRERVASAASGAPLRAPARTRRGTGFPNATVAKLFSGRADVIDRI